MHITHFIINTITVIFIIVVVYFTFAIAAIIFGGGYVFEGLSAYK